MNEVDLAELALIALIALLALVWWPRWRPSGSAGVGDLCSFCFEPVVHSGEGESMKLSSAGVGRVHACEASL